MYQATVSQRGRRRTAGSTVTVTLNGPGARGQPPLRPRDRRPRTASSSRCRTKRSSRPAASSVVYVQQAGGDYAPREIKAGVQGELFTQVLDGPEGGRAGRHDRQLLHRCRAQAERTRSRAPMITAIIEHVIRFRWIVLGRGRRCWSALSVYALRTAALDAIPDISDPQIIVYVEVAAQPAGDRDRGHRAGHPRAGRLARHPSRSRHLAHGVLVRLRHPRGPGPPRGRPAVRRRSPQRDPRAAAAGRQRHRRSERQQHGLDLPVRAASIARGPATCASCGC